MEERATAPVAPPRHAWRDFAWRAAGWLWPLLLYGWGIRRNPLFLCEYSAPWLPAEDLPAWKLRLPAALAVLLAAAALRLTGKVCRERDAGVVAATVFLLTPVVYAGGITANLHPEPWAFVAGTLPWWAFLPSMLRGWFADWGELRRTPLWVTTIAGTLLAALGTLLVPAWPALTILPFLALFAGGGLVRCAELGAFHGIDRTMRILAGIVAAVALTVFVVHIPARFGSAFLARARFYGAHEFFFNPVFAGVICALWLTLAVRESHWRLKFLYLALAVALPLTVLTAGLPERFVRDRAPGGFLRRAVVPEIVPMREDEATLVADAPMRPVVRRLLGREALPFEGETPESLRRLAARPGTVLFVFTATPETRKRIPPPRRSWRSGPFAVFAWNAPGISPARRPAAELRPAEEKR